MAPSNMVATDDMWLSKLKFKFITNKKQKTKPALQRPHPLLSAQQASVVGGCSAGRCDSRPSPPPQKARPGSVGPEQCALGRCGFDQRCHRWVRGDSAHRRVIARLWQAEEQPPNTGSCPPEPVNITLYGKRLFAKAIKLGTVRQRSSRIMTALNAVTSVRMREVQRDT